MFEILFSWLSIPRSIGIWIDSIAYGLIDNIYNLINTLANTELFSSTAINEIMQNTYILVSILAFFRIAILLINAIINPDKLNDKESGLVQILRNLVLMFVFLVIVPIAFSTLRDIQAKVVEGNYINKIFLGQDSVDGKNPGKVMEKIAIGALVYPDEKLASKSTDKNGNTIYKLKDECTGNCKKAIEAYNDMMTSDSGVNWATLSLYIGTSVKVDGEVVYAYHYYFIVTLLVGGIMVWVMLSFALDIAVRAVELAILEVLAPLFIATYVDPKWAKSGPFHNWLTQVGKTYASLFIKLGILAIMLLLIGLIDDLNGGAFINIFVLLGILIFAKKAGEWFAKLIGVGSDSTSLGGFVKKLGSAALIGGALTKGSRAAAGASIGAAQTIHNANKNRRAQKKDARNELGYKRGFSKKARDARDDLYNKNKNDKKYANMSKAQALRKIKKDKYDDYKVGGFKNNLAQTGAAFVAGAVQGGQAGLKADNMKGVFSGSINAANQFSAGVGMKGTDSLLKRGTTWVKGLPGKVSDAWGSSTERFDAREQIAKDKQVAEWTNGKCTSGTEKGQLINGQGAFNQLASNKKLGSGPSATQISTKDDALAAIYASNQGFKLEDVSRTKNSVGELAYEFKDSNGTKITVDASSLQKNLNGIVDPSSSAMTTYDKMWNSYQTSCLNNYTQNQQAYANEAATYQNAYAQSTASLKQAKEMASALAPALTAALGGLGAKTVALDDSTMQKFKETVSNNLLEVKKWRSMTPPIVGAKADELKNAEDALNEISQQLAMKEEFDKQLAESQKTLDTIRSAQDELKIIYDGIEGKTSAEKAQKLAIKEKKISDTLEKFKNKEDK